MALLSRTTYRHRSGLVSVESHILACGLERRREHRVFVNGSLVGLVGSVVSGLRLGRTVLEMESRLSSAGALL